MYNGRVIWRLAQETVSGKDADGWSRRPGESPTADNPALPACDDPRDPRFHTMAATEPEVGASAEEASTLEDSPSRRRNKRKMTEPRRRATDFSIRSICSSSASDVERDDDDAEDDANARSSTDAAVAKIWKPGDVFDACPLTTATTTAPVTNALGFYPLNIPLIHPFHRGISTRYAAAVTPTPLRPASSESSLGSSGDHDRSAQADDTSSSGGRPSRTGMRATTAQRLHAQSSPTSTSRPTPVDGDARYGGRAGSPRKNYKNMTKQRRIEANARERTRVHTISAAFESLRRAVPSYSYNQRLSKLAILRIACSYIVALAKLADLDYSSAPDADRTSTQLSFAECVDLCTQTIQSEGRAKRRH